MQDAVVATRSVAGPLTWITGIIIASLTGILYLDILVDLANEWWTQPEASYGLLIPPFALYVAYLKKNETLSLPAQPSSAGLMLIALACLVLITGKLASEFFLTRISFVPMLGGLVWTFWGFARFRSLAFPLILLLTMVPPPVIVYNAAAAPLQLLASRIAADLAQFVGVSIYRDGNIIHLANTS